MTLVAQRLQKLYQDLSTHRESALAGLDECFTADIHFRDPFRDTHGMAAFRELFVRMFKQYRHVAFTDVTAHGDDSLVTLTYDMHLRMVVGPTFVTKMVSICRVRDGMVYDLADYYDFSSALASPMPLLGTLYRKAVNALFL